MAKSGDLGVLDLNTQRRQQGIVVKFILIVNGSRRLVSQKALVVDQGGNCTAFRQGPDPVKAHGIEPLEDVTVFTVLRCPTMLFDEALDVLETGDDALFLWSATADFLRLDLDPKLGQQGFVFVSEISH